jgi:hypothetical protein
MENVYGLEFYIGEYEKHTLALKRELEEDKKQVLV